MPRTKHFSAYVSANCDPAHAIVDSIRAARSFCEAEKFEERPSAKLLVTVEELVSNSLRHGSNGSDISLQLRLVATKTGVQIEIGDNGVAFDPIRDFKFEGPVRASEGGAGLELVRTWAHSLTYERDGEWNQLVLHLG